METKTYLGGGQNSPGSASAWSPSGPPKPGDALLMSGGVMNIAGAELAGDAVVLRQTPAGKSDVFNLSGKAVLATTTAAGATVNATVNVAGHVSASLGQGSSGTANYTVNLHAGSTLVGRYNTASSGTVRVEAQTGAKFENDANSRNDGTLAVTNADVVGAGSFTVGTAASHPGFLEFGKSVAGTETVNLEGTAANKAVLAIDHPSDFHAAVNMDWGVIDLKNLGGASYTYRDNVLSLFSQGKVVDTLRLHDTTSSAPGAAALALDVERHGTDILVSAGPKLYPTDPALPHRG